MKVKLKVLQGKRAGKEVAIPLGKFLVGRSEECHLRPKSDSISRKHCLISVKKDAVKVKDLGSRNGTFVNDEPVKSCLLESGDHLRIGKIEFEVVVEEQLAAVAAPETEADVRTAAQSSPDESTHIASPNVSDGDDDVTDWLNEGDETDRARQLADPDTRQFMLDVTKKSDSPTEDTEGETKELQATAKKKEPGKLPTLPTQDTDTSRDAAADMLKKFFNRR